MQSLYAKRAASVTELKKNPGVLLQDAKGEPVVILNHNKPMAYFLSAELFEGLMELIDDKALAVLVAERQVEKDKAIEVNIEEL